MTRTMEAARGSRRLFRARDGFITYLEDNSAQRARLLAKASELEAKLRTTHSVTRRSAVWDELVKVRAEHDKLNAQPPTTVRKGDVFPEGHPILKGRDQRLFEEFDPRRGY